jgi:hypothetical protein
MARVRRAVLDVPPVARVVPARVFDAFAWCASDELVLVTPGALDVSCPVTADNPPGLVFLMRAECTFLPRELARLHAPWIEDAAAWSLAPWAIDDATDLLHAQAVRPRDVLSLACANLHQLVWGLHDWAHFHNHGPFVERAWTELQCDVAALSWLRINQDALGLDEGALLAVRDTLVRASRRRFADESLDVKPEPYFTSIGATRS